MKIPFILKVYQVIFVVLLVALGLNLLSYTGFAKLFSDTGKYEPVDFSSGWKTEDGRVLELDSFLMGKQDQTLILEKTLPDKIRPNDELCLITEAANIRVFVGELPEACYEFQATENLTGIGYGTAYHTVNLSPYEAGMKVKLEISSAYKEKVRGHIDKVCLCDAREFRNIFLKGRFIPFLTSLFIMIAGVMIIILRYGIPKNQPLPYNLVALGYALILCGLWFLGETGVFQIIMGNYSFWRVINYTVLTMAIPPLISFVISLMKYKRRIFVHMAFLLPFITIGVMLSARFIFDTDMILMTEFLYASYTLSLLLLIAIIVDNEISCRKNKSVTDIKYFYIGISAFVAGIFADLILFICIYRRGFVNDRGYFTRIGLIVLIIAMLIKAIKWWTNEQTSIARDRFINRLLQYSASSVDTETKISHVLKYLGSEFSADRAYIFEEKEEGLFDNTFEWCEKSVSPQIDTLKGIPYKGTIDVWYEEYKKNDAVLIYDLEEYRHISENMYNVLKPQGIRTLITAPLEVNGQYIGFFGVDNPPFDAMNEIKEILQLLKYFISQLLVGKRYEDKLLHYSYYDSLTGVRNRRAIQEFEHTDFDPSKHFGYIMLDINGLKATNDNLGHEAGDNLLKSVSGLLVKVFGNDNVYRMGGDEFAVYDCESDKSTFEDRVATLRQLITDAGHHISLGSVYCVTGTDDINEVRSKADELMYEEKRHYYEGKNNRRH